MEGSQDKGRNRRWQGNVNRAEVKKHWKVDRIIV